ncbi:MAG: DUF3567 domain-containing protein [Burkholderiaceae bacterium]
MQMVYNSDQYVIVEFDVAVGEGAEARRTGGYEIVDKFARKEIFLEGAAAESFQRGVRELAERGTSPEAFDAFIEGYTQLAQQPVVLH